MLLLLAVLRMGAERSEDRGYLPPCRSFSPLELYRSFLSNFTARDQWWDAPGGQASVWTRRPKAEDLGTLRRSPRDLFAPEAR